MSELSLSLLTEETERELYALRGNACFFTGHRSILKNHCSRLNVLIEEEVEALVYQGFTVFYCGMARGFDMLAARAVWHQQKRNPSVRLICTIPCRDQTRGWNESDRLLYRLFCEREECILLSEAYDGQCMRRRNQFMVDHAVFGICYYRGDSHARSGTGQTLRYADKQRISYLNLVDMLV